MPRLRSRTALLFSFCLSPALLLGSTGATAQPIPPSPWAVRNVEAHTRFLADDLLEGRAAGTRGYDLAALYVETQFRRLGLQPGAGDGMRQLVPMRESRLDLDASQLHVLGAAGTSTLTPLNDMIVRPGSGRSEIDLTAEAVFAGFGIHAPTFGYDDFAGGVDVKNRIVVILAGAPSTLPATARAHFSRNKTAELAARGAIGIVTVLTPAEDRRQPWSFVVAGSRFPAMRLIEPNGELFDGFPGVAAQANVSRTGAGALFTQAGTSLPEVFAASEKGTPQAFPLNVRLRLVGRATVDDVTSHNVLAMIPGADPALASEPVVVTAHLDHLGVGAPVNDDRIYNGAMDNALGIALLLTAAEELAKRPPAARPILFAALTAEEKGLLGAHQLARRLPPGVKQYAANLNFDMPVILAPVRDIIALGDVHSSLGPISHQVARQAGFTVSPDPKPDEVVFVRSDQYAFIRSGVPSLFLKAGQRGLNAGDDLATLEADFRKVHYHKPSDDLSRPIHWESAGAMADYATSLIAAVANEKSAPEWVRDDFFGQLFGPDRVAK